MPDIKKDDPTVQVSLTWFNAVLDQAEQQKAKRASGGRPRWDGLFNLGQASRLREEGEIARGAMGSIHLVYDTNLRRRVALKRIDSELSSDLDHAQRFIDEARITGSLDHPNVVPVHDLTLAADGSAAYSMKLVEGRTLTELIAAQRSQADLERILRCLIGVCEALAFAHSRGIVHRDVKPANIMVGEFGQVYLMDWGCALATGDHALVDGGAEAEGTIVGTVYYMAPEQARGEVSRTDARSDVFAVGAVLFKALTGRSPYTGTLEVALEAAARGEFKWPQGGPGMTIKPPPVLTAIAKKAMAADPAERFQTASEMAEALRAFLRGGNWFPQHQFEPGTAIVREGDSASTAYIIMEGRCKVQVSDPSDPSRRITVRVLGPGDVFGETAIFADAPRSATVVAVDRVNAVVVDKASIERLTEGTHLGRFVKALADRFLDLEATVEPRLHEDRSSARFPW